MELKTAIRILKEWVKQSRAFEKDFNLGKIVSGTLGKKRIDALDTVLKVLDMPEEEVVFYGTRSTGKALKRTYEMGLIVGTKREREYWQNKIKEKIEETRSKMHEFESDNANRLYLEHFNQNYFNRQSKKYGVFNTQEVITHCRLQEYVIKMGALQELLKGE